MSGTFTPRPATAGLGAMIGAYTKQDALLLLRNPEQLLLAVVIPVGVLLGGRSLLPRLQGYADVAPLEVITPGVLGLAIMSTAFTSLAISTGFERRYGVLKWLGATPLPRVGLLAGKVGALLAVQLLQIAVIAGLAATLGWRPESPWVIAVALVLGTAAFSGWALAIAGSLRAEATLGLANLLYVGMAAVGGVVLPMSGAWGEIAHWLPSGALGDLLRSGLAGEGVPTLAVLVLIGWAALGALATARLFRWE